MAARIVLLPLALFLAVLATLTTAWNMRLPIASVAPGLVAAEDPEASARALRAHLASGQLEVPHSLAQSLRVAARRDPLDASAMLLTALERRQEGKTGYELFLLEIARKRDPRNVITRALLLEAYLVTGNTAGGTTELVALDRLSPAAHAALVPLLWNLIEQPATQAATVAALPQSSRLRRPLAQLAARANLAPELVLALQDRAVAQDLGSAERQWVASLILPYVEAGNMAAALSLSRHFYPDPDADADADTGAGLVTDPDFSGFPGPPFGWALDQAQGGLAELRDNQLWVSHYGRSGWTIARQVLHLDPGSYQLSYAITPGAAARPNLVWRVDCLTSGTRLLDLPLNPEQTFGLAPTDRFTVPGQGCGAQRLVLAARAGDPASTRTMAFQSVEIVPAGGS